MKKVRIGIIGVGNMGSSHSKNLTTGQVPNMELTAICDINPSKLNAFEKMFGEQVKQFKDAEAMMDSGLCDSILVAVPHYEHAKYVMMAMEKGLHVISEKPAGVYTKQVEEMNRCADKHDVVFGMMFNQRTNCVFRKMKELVSSGELGQIKRVSWIITTWYRTQYYYDSGAWRATWNGEGGGVLLNQCPHNLDLLQWICGMPKKVTAFCHEGKWHDIEVEDDVTAYLEYDNGATGTFVTTTGDAPGPDRFEIVMEHGKLVCNDSQTLKLYKLEQNEREFCMTSKEAFGSPKYTEVEIDTDGINEQHIGVLKAFAGRILDGTPLVADGKEGIHGLELSNCMHLSSWMGKTIELPIDSELFLKKLNEKRATSRIKVGEDIISDTSNSYNN